MEVYCATCLHSMINNNNGELCDLDCEDHNKWKPYNKPKEDTMPAIRKPIFESEEEYDSIIKIMGFVVPHNHKKRAREFGLIRRDPVEEAEEMYQEWLTCQRFTNESDIKFIRKQREAIQHMKPYYEKYKGEQQ